MGQIKLIFNKVEEALASFYASFYYIAFISVLGSVSFIFRLEIYALAIITIVGAISWVIMKDLTPSMGTALILGMIPLARYAEVDYFMPLLNLLFIVIPLIIIRLFRYPVKLTKTRFFYSTVFVAIAITLGGLFSPYFTNNFTIRTGYYYFFLGIGMVAIYVILENATPMGNIKQLKYLCHTMIGVGLMGVVLIATPYVQNWDYVIENGLKVTFQWRNSTSNNLLITMPFAFYLAVKNKYSLLYFLFGTIQFLALLFSMSRGGMIFGTLTFIPLVIMTLMLKRKQILSFSLILILVFGGIYLLFEKSIGSIMQVIEDLIGRIQISNEEARANLLRMAFANFREYPIFGTGFGFDTAEFYDPQAMSMHWYHSTIAQVMGSLGIVGIVAYIYQTVIRVYTLFEKKQLINLFFLVSIIGFGGYSLVNVGLFIPLPLMAVWIHIFIILGRCNSLTEDYRFPWEKKSKLVV